MSETTNYIRIAESIKYLSANYKKQPSLEEVAQHIHLSSFHFQRIFTEWAGISPKKFLQYLTVEELKKEIQNTDNLIQAAENVGLSAQSRVYDLFVNIEAVTPDEFKNNGKGIEIEYGFHNTPFGQCFIANTKRGICSLSFYDGNENNLLAEFTDTWNNAVLSNNQDATKNIVEKLFFEPLQNQKFNLLLKGTKFQIKVWQALLNIPFGSVSTYQSLANAVGNSNASRAVGSAIGKNPVAFLIPCHRVIQSSGLIGQYHWGSERKSAIIGWEKAKLEIGYY
jgi:AraC family transcriptional regulator, regulatory protein of adaptative response / methylated-DNA-[protein]-cysteine methyltransferase